MSEVIHLHQPTLFAGLTGVIDHQNCVVHGVSLITSGITATGHDLFVDDTSVNTFHEMGTRMEQLPVNLDHGSGIISMNGYIDNFRKDNGKWRGDWHLLKSHAETPVMLERCERQSKTFGFSLAFSGDKQGVLRNGRKCAHPEALLSADCVVRPAANKSLFSVPVDNRKNHVSRQTIELHKAMPNTQDLQNQPSLADVLAELQAVRGELAQQQEITQQLVGHANASVTGAPQAGEVDPEFLSALNEASDEELAAYNQQNGTNISRADVNAAVSEYNAGLAANQGEEQGEEGDGQFEGSYGEQGQGETAGAAAGGGAEMGAAGPAFAALQKELIELKRKFNAKEQKEIQFAEAQATNDVRTKISTIVAQRDQSIQLAEKLVAENEALRMHVRTGTRPVIAGIDTGIRLFSRNESGELHPWQERVRQIELSEKVSTAKAMTMADKEDNGAAHSDFIASQSPRNARR
jgi:hypothetical protein